MIQLKEYHSTPYFIVWVDLYTCIVYPGFLDYKVKFFVKAAAGQLNTANAKIAAFNASLHGTPDANGQKEYYQVEFYNDYKRHKIVGYPHEIAEATDFWRDPTNQVNDVVVVEWTIRVTKPSLCDFSL